MLTFSEIAKIFEELELKLIASLKRNLSKHKAWEKDEGFNWSAWQAEKLRNMNKFRRENQEILGEYTDVIDKETSLLMEEQFKEGEELVNSQLEADVSLINEAFFGVNEQKMKTLIEDVTRLEKDVSSAAIRMTDDVYRQTVNKVQLEMATGSTTLPQAIDSAVRDFLDKGINCIVYKDGRRVNIADYVMMALRTTSTRATLQGEAKRRSELGYDTVVISQYGMCSETCLPWQGRVYIDDVFTIWSGEISGDKGKSNYCGKWFTLLSVAIKGGLFHPNCRHSMDTWIDGVSTLPKLLDINKVREKAKLEAKQRRLENKVRKAKRKVLGFSDPHNIKQAKAEQREAQKELREFVSEHSNILNRDYSREKVYNTSISTSPKNIEVLGGFAESEEISEDIKSEIMRSIDKVQLEYDIRVDECIFTDIGKEYGKVPFQFYPVNDNGKFKGRFIINKGFDWEENLDKLNERIYTKNYKKGVLASKNTENLIYHEMAHFMSFQDCNSYYEFTVRERELRSLFVAGVSGFSDMSEDGAETIAEGFVRVCNGEIVDERVKDYINIYIERWRK